jgi:hypothetical protein
MTEQEIFARIRQKYILSGLALKIYIAERKLLEKVKHGTD